MEMKSLFLTFFFVFSAYSTENSEERILFTVEDTPKEFFDVEDTEKPHKPSALEEAVVSSESPAISKPIEEQTPVVLLEETVTSSEIPKSQEESVVSLEPEVPLKEEELIMSAPDDEEDIVLLESEIEEQQILSEEESEETAAIVVEIPKPKMDILIVIDNSGSMKFILRGIGRKMQTFKETLDPFDYRIAFLSAKVNPDQDKRLMDLEHRGQILTQQKFLEPGMDNQILIDTLVRGKGDKCDKPPYCGGRSERPLGALEAYFFLPDTEDFIRGDSEGVAVVVITDNDENQRSKEEPGTTAEDVVSIFNQRYPNKKLKAYTLTILDKQCQAEIRRKQLFFREGNFAPSVEALVGWTGGDRFSLCLPSYQEVAEQIVSDFFFNE